VRLRIARAVGGYGKRPGTQRLGGREGQVGAVDAAAEGNQDGLVPGKDVLEAAAFLL
jgi:hypothetical protein